MTGASKSKRFVSVSLGKEYRVLLFLKCCTESSLQHDPTLKHMKITSPDTRRSIALKFCS